MINSKENQIIHMIYDASLSHRWNQVIEEIIKYMQCHSGMLTVFNQLDLSSNLIYTFNLSEKVLDIYNDTEIQALDMELHQPLLLQGEGHIVPIDFSSYATMPEMSKQKIFYERCIVPSGVMYAAPLLLEQGRYHWGLLSVHRTKSMPFFSKEECIKLEYFSIHLQRALQIYRQLHGLQSLAKNAYQLLDDLNIGVIVINSKKELIHSNQSAKETLRQSNLLWLDNQNKIKTKLHFQSQLYQAIYSIFKSTTIQDVGGTMMLYEHPSDPLLQLSIIPFSSEYALNSDLSDKAVIIITNTKQHYQLSTHYLIKTYDLSLREIQVCELFINGFDLDEICEQLKIKKTSVRTYFKNIYEKTNLTLQNELLHLLIKTSVHFKKTPPKQFS